MCPADYDLGEDLRVVLLSTTEGEDKPLKYPPMFHSAQVAIVTKSDLAAAAGLQPRAGAEQSQTREPTLRGNLRVIIEDGRGGYRRGWISWLSSRGCSGVSAKRRRLKAVEATAFPDAGVHRGPNGAKRLGVPSPLALCSGAVTFRESWSNPRIFRRRDAALYVEQGGLTLPETGTVFSSPASAQPCWSDRVKLFTKFHLLGRNRQPPGVGHMAEDVAGGESASIVARVGGVGHG